MEIRVCSTFATSLILKRLGVDLKQVANLRISSIGSQRWTGIWRLDSINYLNLSIPWVQLGISQCYHRNQITKTKCFLYWRCLWNKEFKLADHNVIIESKSQKKNVSYIDGCLWNKEQQTYHVRIYLNSLERLNGAIRPILPKLCKIVP